MEGHYLYFHGYKLVFSMTFMLTYKWDLMAEEDTNRGRHKGSTKKQILFESEMIGEHESCLI